MQDLFIEFLPPWVETNLQPAFYDAESGTVLQQTARMYGKINELIKSVNNMDKVIKEYVDYIDNYFKNLDVQDEINNKLDEMAEGGQLVEIIGAYLDANAMICFDTLNDLKESDNLIAGSVARTKGCLSVGDNGEATYYIRTKESEEETDDYKIIAYGNSLVAEKVIGLSSTPEQYGAVGDGEENDRAALRLCLGDGSIYKNFRKGAIYKINNNLDISANKHIVINGNFSTIFCHEGCAAFYCYAWNANIDGIEINELTIDGDRSNATHQNTAASQFSCGNSKSIKNIHLRNCTFNNFYRSALGLYNDNSTRSALTYTGNVTIENCEFNNISDVAIQSSNYSARVLNCNFDNIGAECITIDNGCEDYVVDGCRMTNYKGGAGAIGTDESKDVRIVNNLFNGSGMLDQYGPALSINANTGINYNMVVSGNTFVNNKYSIAIAPHYSADYVKAVESLSITGNAFKDSTISDIVIYKYGSGSKISIIGNSSNSSAHIDNRMTTLINQIKCDTNLALTCTAGTGFTLVKNNSQYINGVLYLDAVVSQTDSSLEGWNNVITMNIETPYKALYEAQLDENYGVLGFLDSQISSNAYRIYIPTGTTNKFIIKKTIKIY